MKTKLSLDLPPLLHQWLETQSSVSGFASPGEYVAHLLLEQRRSMAKEKLEQRLIKALEANDFFDLTDEHFDMLDQKLVANGKSRKAKRHALKR